MISFGGDLWTSLGNIGIALAVTVSHASLGLRLLAGAAQLAAQIFTTIPAAMLAAAVFRQGMRLQREKDLLQRDTEGLV